MSYSKISDITSPEAEVDRKTWREWGILSNLNIPIIIGGPVTHVITFNSVKSERVWPDEFIPRLRLLGEIFVNAIERSRTLKALRETEQRLVRDNEILDQTRKTLEERLQFEELLSSLSARFINLPFERVDEAIHSGMEAVLDFFKVDRIGLFQILPERKSWIITHYVSAEGVPPIPIGTEFPLSGNPWSYEKLFLKREIVKFSRVDDVSAEAEVDKRFWNKYGMRSNLTIPIMIGEAVNYFISINSVTRERVWPEEYIPGLRMLGEIFANAVERGRAQKSLQESENQLSLAISAAGAGLWDMDISCSGSGFPKGKGAV